MAEKEASTDILVSRMLEECGIAYDPQGSNVKQVEKALQSASKHGTGKAGRPDFTAVIGEFLLVIEDKARLDRQIRLTSEGEVDFSMRSITDYAVNGACFYAEKIVQNSGFGKVFALGISGDASKYEITPVFVGKGGECKKLPDVKSLIWFSRQNIGEYYARYVLEEETDSEKTNEKILKDAAELHEYLRAYGALKDQDKPLVVAAILLALDEIKTGGFSLASLTGDQTLGLRDGDKLMNAVKGRLTRSNVGPDAKKTVLLSEFSILQNSFRLNEVDESLGITPLKFYTEFLYERVFRGIKYQNTSEDFIGRFYGEFMSYSGGDGQSLGIILTPKHICDLMCDMTNVGPNDNVLDPTCGTGGFLIAAMRRMLSLAESETQKDDIKGKQLHGFELQSNMFAIAVANMILRRDGKSNLECCNFLKKDPKKVQEEASPTVGLMNPPYSQGSKAEPEQYELSFVEHLLDCMAEGGRVAVIVPQSVMTGKSKAEQAMKMSIMSKHTLEGVITCNTDTFHGIGVNPAIAVFTAHVPHSPEKLSKFIDFQDDGWEWRTHVGLVEKESARDKKQYLLDVWDGKIEAPSSFCVKSFAAPQDEWLHSFYFVSSESPTDVDFEKGVGEWLSFEFSMIMQNRSYLFSEKEKAGINEEPADIQPLQEKEWKDFRIGDLFEVERPVARKEDDFEPGPIPFVASGSVNNGVIRFCAPIEGKKVDKGKCLTVSPVDGSSFYQPVDFMGRGGAGSSILILRRPGMNLYRGLFTAQALRHTCSKYSYGHMGSKEGILRERIMLPVTDLGSPDFSYMEAYVRHVLIFKRRQYLDFLNS